MEGWFVSSGLLGCVFGVLAAGRLCDRVGRKQIMLLSAALLAIAAVACAAAPAASWLIVGRFIGGLGVGLAPVVSPLYISEVATPKYRGRPVRAGGRRVGKEWVRTVRYRWSPYHYNKKLLTDTYYHTVYN